jgi:hypothetical protein
MSTPKKKAPKKKRPLSANQKAINEAVRRYAKNVKRLTEKEFDDNLFLVGTAPPCMERSFEMHYTIYVLEQTISDLEPYRDDGDGAAEQIAELKEAIAILEKHAKPTPCTIQLNC